MFRCLVILLVLTLSASYAPLYTIDVEQVRYGRESR